MTQMKNRVSGLLMETGVIYNKQRLHKVGYFRELLSTNAEGIESVRPLLKRSRAIDVSAQYIALEYEAGELPLTNDFDRAPIFNCLM